jgi:hypothetical protein
MRSSGMLAAFAVTGVLVSAACGGSSHATKGSAPFATSTTDSNQIRLTAGESMRLVGWAETFRACMVGRGIALGPLEKSETQIRLGLPASLSVKRVVAETNVCGEDQGGPPHRSSLQYRPGEIVLYLPKRCLLDEKVAAS